jgi:hypothetical protein
LAAALAGAGLFDLDLDFDLVAGLLTPPFLAIFIYDVYILLVLNKVLFVYVKLSIFI